MKKGFTLVELAIVLVIIGLIMGMAIKGKSLIDVARMRSEIQKISKMEAGLAMYAARVGGASGRSVTLPHIDDDPAKALDINTLVNMNLVSANDIKSAMVANTAGTANEYEMWKCSANKKATVDPSTGKITAPATGFKNDATVSGVCAVGIGMNVALICSIESFLDNENASTGDSRVWLLDATTKIVTADYLDCIGANDGETESFAVNIM